jgi:hypothetical protein
VLYPTETLDFEAWVLEELEYLNSVGTEPVQDALAVKYVESLESLWKYEYVTVKFLMYLGVT